MAALTSSGARNAREIVILTLRTLQFSRFAMLSVLVVASETMPVIRTASTVRVAGIMNGTAHPIVFLFDVDNTLLDNDGIQQDLKDHLERAYGRDARDRYWRILEDLFSELGYRDYLGALQRFRAEHPREVELLAMSSYLIDYPFAGRLFPSASRY